MVIINFNFALEDKCERYRSYFLISTILYLFLPHCKYVLAKAFKVF